MDQQNGIAVTASCRRKRSKLPFSMTKIIDGYETFYNQSQEQAHCQINDQYSSSRLFLLIHISFIHLCFLPYLPHFYASHNATICMVITYIPNKL